MSNKRLKILLVRPPRIKQAVTLGEFMFAEPIGLEIVYAVLSDEYDVKILDLMVSGENFESTCDEFNPDVVGRDNITLYRR